VTEEVDSLGSEKDRLDAEIADATARGDDARAALEAQQASLRAVAVATYVQGRDPVGEQVLAGAEEAAVSARQDAMVNDVAERRTDQARASKRVIEETDGIIEESTSDLATVQERLDAAIRLRDETADEVESRREATDGARRTTADWRLAADVSGSDLPLVALDAYVKAAVRMAFEQPQCGIRWWGLAGIGKVESGHGTYGGARLTASGDTSQRIIGIPLDGSNGTAVVGDSDGGAYDGDPTVDRAVGPMQFIPTSWVSLGRDGNGDGRADPHNIYDAALAAAGLLCRAGGSGLDTDAGLHRAALGYNNSGHYASLVVRTAKDYASREAQLIPPPPPTTTTTTPAPVTPAPTTPTTPTTAPPVVVTEPGTPAPPTTPTP
jgi:membrane-bound lytic murein transglycosylase B